MDSELVTGSQSNTNTARGGGTDRPPRAFRYTDKFEELCPIYMLMGMSYDEFWNGDCMMVVAVRKAYELRQEEENRRAWAQGLYFYEALCDVAPALRAVKPKKPVPYPTEPHPLKKQTEVKRERTVSEEEKRAKRGKTYMEIFAVSFNKQFQQQQEKKGG